MSALKTLKQAVDRLGVAQTAVLLAQKAVKQTAYSRMLTRVREHPDRRATLLPSVTDRKEIAESDAAAVIEAAEEMLRDENQFFTFPYQTRDLIDPWNFDPIENKHWPRRHYTEQKLHAADTPRDVKITWEINRFKDLPVLAQAAYLTKDAKYALEVERRILSWIEGNPFANSINWASGLELGIRLISWTFSLRLLEQAGFTVHQNEKIERSIWEHVHYLAAELSTDKVVRTNHLIGEVAGLFIASAFWKFDRSTRYQAIARKILESEILRQTFSDGVTREASSWYHQFVTHFFELVHRSGLSIGEPMSTEFDERLAAMQTYLAAMNAPDASLMRVGDADDGWALWLLGDRAQWLNIAFATASLPTAQVPYFFAVSGQSAVHIDDTALYVRGGQFGMGGAGFSSHAHDDLLSPILWLRGLPVLADPGTFVYNGDPEGRAAYRGAEAHNGAIVQSAIRPTQRMNFGWHTVRPAARLDAVMPTRQKALVKGAYGDVRGFERRLELATDKLLIEDHFESAQAGEWNFHLHPIWHLHEKSGRELVFLDSSGVQLHLLLDDKISGLETRGYNFSPSYRVAETGVNVHFTWNGVGSVFTVFSLR